MSCIHIWSWPPILVMYLVHHLCTAFAHGSPHVGAYIYVVSLSHFSLSQLRACTYWSIIEFVSPSSFVHLYLSLSLSLSCSYMVSEHLELDLAWLWWKALCASSSSTWRASTSAHKHFFLALSLSFVGAILGGVFLAHLHGPSHWSSSPPSSSRPCFSLGAFFSAMDTLFYSILMSFMLLL